MTGLKPLASVRVTLVGRADSPESARVAGVLEERGAAVAACLLGTNDLSRLGEGDVDAVVLVVDDDVEGFEGLASILASDARLSRLSVVAVVPPDLPASRAAGLVGAMLVTADAGDEGLVGIVNRARHRGRASALATYLGRASSSLSHDVLALTNVIVGYGGNLRDEIVGPLTELQKEHVARVLEAATGITDIIEGFSTRTREAILRGVDEEGKAPTRRGLHSLTDLARSTTALFEGKAAAKSIRLVAGGDDGARVWCDAVEIRQVVMNLVNNALKFTPDGGLVTVDVRKVPTSIRGGVGVDARNMVELVVTDSGPGVPPSKRGSVFERGARLNRDVDVPGQGIGLSIVRDIVVSHGGEIRIDGGSGEGAVFVVTLPVDRRLRRMEGAST